MKRIPFLIITLLLAISAYGQIQTKVTFGISSMNIAVKTGESRIFDQESKLGYYGGLSVVIGNKFIVESGIFYHLFKSEMSITGVNDIEVVRSGVDIQMLRIPVFAGYSIVGNQRRPMNLRIFAGPVLNVTTFVATDDPAAELDKSDFENFYLGVSAGAGVNLGIFFFDVSYDAGLMKFIKTDSGNAKNNIYTMGFGVRF